MPTADSRRLFIALDAPSGVVDALAVLREDLPGFAWTPPAQLHLTLRFLGDVPVAAIAPLRARLATIRVAPFLLPIEGLGCFPPHHRPHVLWCGVGGGHPRLHQLRQRVDDAVLASGLAPEMRSFVPHFTLARVGEAKPGAVEAFVHRHREFVAATFRVERFRLYASELRPTGAVHTVLEEFPLSG